MQHKLLNEIFSFFLSFTLPWSGTAKCIVNGTLGNVTIFKLGHIQPPDVFIGYIVGFATAKLACTAAATGSKLRLRKFRDVTILKSRAGVQSA